MAQGTKQTHEKDKIQGTSQASQGLATTRGQGLARGDQFWSPFSFIDNFRREIDRLFDDFAFGRSFLPTFGGFDRQGLGTNFAWSPQTEVFERDNQLIVRADLPGLRKEDVNVDLEENRITIRGARKSEHEENREGVYRSERSYGSFYRAIPLPEGVDGERAKASFKDGVLEITMPLPEKKPTGKKIEIE